MWIIEPCEEVYVALLDDEETTLDPDWALAFPFKADALLYAKERHWSPTVVVDRDECKRR